MNYNQLSTYEDFPTDQKYWNYIKQAAVNLAENVTDPPTNEDGARANAHALVYDSEWFSHCDEDMKGDLMSYTIDALTEGLNDD